jgi:hypothetical protein
VFAVRGLSQRSWKSRRPQNRRSALPDILYLSFVFIDILALFRRIQVEKSRVESRRVTSSRHPDQTSSAAALFPGERVARVASQVRGFFPLVLATSEFGFSSRILCSKLGSFWVRFEFVFQTHPVFSITYWLRSYYFCVFVVPPGSLAKSRGRENESESPGMAHCLPSCNPKDGVDGWLPNSSTL